MSTAAPHLVLVTPRHSYRTGAFLDAAADLGCRVTVVTDADVALPGSAVVVDLADPGAAVDEIVGRLPGSPDAVVGTDGAALVVAAVLAEHEGLVTSPSVAVRRASDKCAQRAAGDRGGWRQPRWGTVGPNGSVPDLGPGPVVVKPTDRSGGQGVIRADTTEDRRRVVARVRSLVGPEAPILVERYVHGREFAVDALVADGDVRPIAVFDKPDAGSGPFFAETMLVRPGRLTEDERDELLRLVDAVVRRFGLTDGVVHVEAVIDADGAPWFLELAPRSIGGRCAQVLRPAGRSMEHLVLSTALGRPGPTGLEPEGAASGVCMIPVPGAGELDQVVGVRRARAVPGITGVEITTAPGTTVVPLPEGDRYVGFVFAVGDGPDEVEAVLRRAVGELGVSVSPSGSTDRRRRRDR